MTRHEERQNGHPRSNGENDGRQESGAGSRHKLRQESRHESRHGSRQESRHQSRGKGKEDKNEKYQRFIEQELKRIRTESDNGKYSPETYITKGLTKEDAADYVELLRKQDLLAQKMRTNKN